MLDLGGLEGADELATDDLALLLGVGDAGEGVEELLLRVDHDQRDAGRGDEVALDLLGLALAHQAVVDVDAGEPVADRLLHDGGGDRRVDPAGEAADGPAVVADLLADPLDLLLDDVDRSSRSDGSRRCRRGSARAPSGRARCAAPRGATARRRTHGRRARTRPPASRRRREYGRTPPERRSTESPWDIHTLCSVGSPAEQGAGVARHGPGCARTRGRRSAATVPPRPCAISWKP